jgi:hypothetical protein
VQQIELRIGISLISCLSKRTYRRRIVWTPSVAPEVHEPEIVQSSGVTAFSSRELAESEGHHPDVSFGWGYATVSLRTKKIKGLHENDFIMAAKIDRLAQPSKG